MREIYDLEDVRQIYDLKASSGQVVKKMIGKNRGNATHLVLKTLRENQKAQNLSRYLWIFCIVVHAEKTLEADQDTKGLTVLHCFVQVCLEKREVIDALSGANIGMLMETLENLHKALHEARTFDGGMKAIKEAASHLLLDELVVSPVVAAPISAAQSRSSEETRGFDIPRIIIVPYGGNQPVVATPISAAESRSSGETIGSSIPRIFSIPNGGKQPIVAAPISAAESRSSGETGGFDIPRIIIIPNGGNQLLEL